jgi:hypothetical protein
MTNQIPAYVERSDRALTSTISAGLTRPFSEDHRQIAWWATNIDHTMPTS